MSRLKERYKTEAVPALVEQFGFSNIFQAPGVEKIVINMGVGDATDDSKALDSAIASLTAISGQKPAITRSKRAVANFKLREGVPIGCMVTLRGWRMYDFLDKLINAVLPRIRDFRGLSPRSFDGRGNYTFGIREQIIFPEVDYDSIDKIRGMDLTIVTSATNDEEGLALLAALGMPFRQN